MANDFPILDPPRLTGNPTNDLAIIREYLTDIFQKIVLEIDIGGMRTAMSDISDLPDLPSSATLADVIERLNTMKNLMAPSG